MSDSRRPYPLHRGSSSNRRSGQAQGQSEQEQQHPHQSATGSEAAGKLLNLFNLERYRI